MGNDYSETTDIAVEVVSVKDIDKIIKMLRLSEKSRRLRYTTKHIVMVLERLKGLSFTVRPPSVKEVGGPRWPK